MVDFFNEVQNLSRLFNNSGDITVPGFGDDSSNSKYIALC